MRIAYITHEYPPDTGLGGIGTYTLHMAIAMQNKGHDVEVFTASFDREISHLWKGVLTHRINIGEISEFKTNIVAVFNLRHKEEPFDIMECPENKAEAELLKMEYPNIPLVVRFHAPGVLVSRLQNSYVSNLIKWRFFLGALKRGRIDMGYWSKRDKNQYKDQDFLITVIADALIAPSYAMRDWVVKFWGIDKERISVVANPYSPVKELLELAYSGNTKYITFLGRMSIAKGVVAFTIAVRSILSMYPDWKLRFIGSDQESHIKGLSMKEYVKDVLKENLHQLEFIDWIDTIELPNYFRDTDIVVIPSLFESFSYVCAEAMGAGRAIIGSNSGGMKELLDDCGILIEPKSSQQIGKAIHKLIRNIDLRQDYARRARERILSEYNYEVIGSRMQRVYKDLVLKNRK